RRMGKLASGQRAVSATDGPGIYAARSARSRKTATAAVDFPAPRPRLSGKYNSAGQLLVESKQDMRRRGVPSPDEADAVALCFSESDGAAFPRDKNFHRDLRDRYEGLYI